METSITKDKRLILKVNCSPMKLGWFSLTRMHSLRKDLIKFKNGGFKKKEEKRKRKEKGRNRKFFRKPFHKYHEKSPRQIIKPILNQLFLACGV